MQIKNIKYSIWLFMGCLAAGSCNKFVDTILPVDQITATTVFSSDKSLVSALSGAYGNITNIFDGTVMDASLFADEMTYLNATGQYLDEQENTYTSQEDFQYLTNYYNSIYNANAIIEALENPAPALTAATISQVRGEAKFLRAFVYFQLVNFYGAIPLVKTTDVQVSAYLGNASVDSVYASIIQDLKDAAGGLTDTYPTQDRIRVNKEAVNAFLSKVYLYRQNWVAAEAAATGVIGSGLYSLTQDLNAVFVNGSNETIWEFWNQNGYTSYAQNVFPSDPSQIYRQVRSGLVHAFEPNDQRKAAWIQAGTGLSDTTYYEYKYRETSQGANVEYLVVQRLAEMYLIRAEARAEQDNVTDGLADVNVVRARAGLPPATAASKDELLVRIMQERRIELMFEDCNRWFDLKRTGTASAILTPLKPGFTEHALLLPFPQTILLKNKNLVQNPGY